MYTCVHVYMFEHHHVFFLGDLTFIHAQPDSERADRLTASPSKDEETEGEKGEVEEDVGVKDRSKGRRPHLNVINIRLRTHGSTLTYSAPNSGGGGCTLYSRCPNQLDLQPEAALLNHLGVDYCMGPVNLLDHGPSQPPVNLWLTGAQGQPPCASRASKQIE